MSSLATTSGRSYEKDLCTSRKRRPCISCARRPGTKPMVRSASPPIAGVRAKKALCHTLSMPHSK
eukprot:10791417-Prorocentrum_lima.AAC.1